VVLDAKRRQVYAALFMLAGNHYETVFDATLLAPSELLTRAPRPLTLIGEGLRYHEPVLRAADVHLLDEEETWMPRAEAVHQLGWELAYAGRFTPVENLVPIYIRPPEAEEVWAARQEASRKETDQGR
jgi:tRNA A37 threonylcarbamoyladenosine modification protein TsaB